MAKNKDENLWKYYVGIYFIVHLAGVAYFLFFTDRQKLGFGASAVLFFNILGVRYYVWHLKRKKEKRVLSPP